MNIFATSSNAYESATALDDVRLRKMVLETAQLICTAQHHDPSLAPPLWRCDLYKTTHANHPCAVWARENYDNFFWLCDHFLFLSEEYERRFDKRHGSTARFGGAIFSTMYMRPRIRHPADFADCTTYKCDKIATNAATVHVNYRLYLQDKWIADHGKNRAPKWTRAAPPAWATRYAEFLNSQLIGV